MWGSYGARIPWYRSSQMRRSFTRCPSPSRVVVRCLRRPGRCRRGGPRGFLEVENGDEFDILRRRCCLHESSGARDRFSSHPRVSNRSASPLARRLSTCISRKTLGKNLRLSVNAPAGSEWRRCTPFKRPLAHVMSPTHSRHALHDPPTSDISQHVVSAESRRHRGPSDTRTISTPHGAPTASHRRRPSIPRPR